VSFAVNLIVEGLPVGLGDRSSRGVFKLGSAIKQVLETAASPSLAV
jgi:hypothetical protein